MKIWKKSACVFLAAAMCISLSGCGYRELYERLLIHGIGVDVTDDGFIVTVRSSISTEDEGEEYFKVQGASVLEALNNLSLRTGRQPFYAHNYLVVFGKSCGQQGLDRCIDFFVRYYNTRPAVQMFLAENTAEEVLSAEKEGKLMKMSELQQLGLSSRLNGKTVGVELLDFVNGIKREGSSSVLPVVKATDEGVEISETAYFHGYKQEGTLTLEETRGYLAVKDKIEKGETVVKAKGQEEVTLSLSSGGGSVEVKLKDGQPQFSLKVDIKADVSAVAGGVGRLDPQAYALIEKETAKIIKENIRSAIDKAVRRDGCDIFGFGNLLYQKHPEYWREYGDGWEEAMRHCSYQVEVNAKVLTLK